MVGPLIATRRSFLQALAATTLLAQVALAEDRATGRKMTMDLVCGNLGVRADLPTAVSLAHTNGFESVAPDAGYLGKLGDGPLQEFLGHMKSDGLTWGATGLPVDFRG